MTILDTVKTRIKRSILPERPLATVRPYLADKHRYDFSINGCRFILEARNDKEAWDKARRIVGRKVGELRRIA